MFKTTIVTLTPPERYFPRLPAPKSFIGQKIDEAVEALEEELWYTKRLLFENEDHGHFVEQVQTAVEARRVAESKVREKRAWSECFHASS